MKIGVFDSGVGGLTVVQEIIRQMPTADILYIGDSKHVPYGTKTIEELRTYVGNILDFLEGEKVDVIVFACNTATSLLLEEMRVKRQTPLMGMIEAGAEMAKKASKTGVGVIATTNTVRSGAYEQALRKKECRLPIQSWACDQLVQMVETVMSGGQVEEQSVSDMLRGWNQNKGDTLILGCTHFPLITSYIVEEVGEGVTIVNPAIEVARCLAEGEQKSAGSGTIRCYTSGDTAIFEQQVEAVLGCEVSVKMFKHT